MPEPNVISCSVMECVFNTEMDCHAPSITVGGDHPNCDTFSMDDSESKSKQPEISEVQDCMVEPCKYNNEMECNAPGITVGHHASHADCNTYQPR